MSQRPLLLVFSIFLHEFWVNELSDRTRFMRKNILGLFLKFLPILLDPVIEIFFEFQYLSEAQHY